MQNKSLLFLSAILLIATAAVSCKQETITEPESTNDEQYPSHIENVALYFEDETKVDINGSTGISTWTSGDKISYYVYNTVASNGSYNLGTVSNGSVSISLNERQSRRFYAVYPASSALPANYGDPTLQVIYPLSIDVTGKNSETYSPVPMIAQNADEQALTFYHVGGLLRISLSDIPTGTTKFKVLTLGFSGNLTGYSTISSPNTNEPVSALPTGGSPQKYVYICNTDGFSSSASINIPLPAGDYSSLTGIRIDAYNSSDVVLGTAIKLVDGWGTVSRRTGKKMAINFNTDISPIITGGNGKFRDLYLSSDILKWDATNNYYTFSGSDDPFVQLSQYKVGRNITYHTWAGNANSLYARLTGGTQGKNSVVVAPLPTPAASVGWSSALEGWRIPSIDDWNRILNGNPSSYGGAIVVNNSTVSKGYAHVLVDCTNADASHKGWTSYSGSGTTFSTSGTQTSNYQLGLLLIPDGSFVICEELELVGSGNQSKVNKITYSQLVKFMNNGCAFLPASGWEYGDYPGWQYAGRGAGFYSSTNTSSGSGYHMYFTYYELNYARNYLYTSTQDAYPVRLVHE